MQVIYLDSSTEKLLECKPNETKVLLGMVRLAKNNIVDLHRKNGKLQKLVDLSDKSIESAITGLRKKGIIVKTGVPRVWFIDPSYFLKGYYQKIYSIAKLIEEQTSGLLEIIDDWEEEDVALGQDLALQCRWDKMRQEQADYSAQVKIVENIEQGILK